MTNFKVLGLVLLVGSLTAYLAVRESGFDFSQHEELKTAHHDHDWETWKAKHGKTFGVHEESIRKDMFQKQAQWVSEHNSQNNTYEVEVNHFAALSDEEFAALYLGDDGTVTEDNIEFLDEESVDEAGGSIDWTSKGAVTGVKNQGSCGSCWSFSATGALEGFKKVKDGSLVSLSEQQLIDCSSSYGNNGCGGGLALNAFNYVKANGIVSGSSYPYKGSKGACHVPSVAKFKISGYKQVPVGNTAQMQAALNKQPVAVSVAANSQVFRSYKNGVLNNAACGTALNHAVLAVGYVSGQHWKVKNSWGSGWGQGGYINIAMKGGEGICGINKRVTYPY